MKTIAFDNTLFTSLVGCARLAENRFIKLQVSPSKSNSLETGALAHIILEYYGKALIEGKSRSDAIDQGFIAGNLYVVGCSACKDDNCDLHKNEWKGLQSTPEKSDKYNIGWSYVFDTMKQYFDYWRSDAFTILGVEETRGRLIPIDDEIQVLWKA